MREIFKITEHESTVHVAKLEIIETQPGRVKIDISDYRCFVEGRASITLDHTEAMELAAAICDKLAPATDYRALLVRYMAGVIEAEGTAFIGGNSILRFTEEELDVLHGVKTEAIAKLIAAEEQDVLTVEVVQPLPESDIVKVTPCPD